MERIPTETPEGKHLRLLLYQASSIADMHTSRRQVSEDAKDEFSTNHVLVRALAAPGIFFDRVITEARGREYNFPGGALIYIPVVRHFPIQDDTEYPDRLTISDPTGNQTVRLPNQLAVKALETVGVNLNPKVAKETSWSSDVVLAATFNNWRDQIFLVHIFNRYVQDTEKAEALALMRKFVAQGFPLGLLTTPNLDTMGRETPNR
jgi:hypothetical protein